MRTETKDQTEGFLIHWSCGYDLFVGPLVRRTDKPILALAEIRAGDAVLDVGTGPGFLARTAAGMVGPAGRAVGLDASPEMVDRATQVAKRKGLSATFVLAGAQKMPFDDAEFDAAVSRLAMHHIPTMRKEAIAEIHRVLRPGGRVVIADLASHSTGGLVHDLVGRAHGRSGQVAGEIEGLIRAAGFADIETGRLGLLAYVKAHKP